MRCLPSSMVVVVLVVACLGTGGCGTAAQRNEDLLYDVRTFQEGLRWRKYEMAADYVPAAIREKFLEAHDEVDGDLRIDDYELERVKLDEASAATVRVKYTWHLNSVGTVHDTVVEQRWERQGKVWRITANAHKKGEEMPRAVVVSDGQALP
jgi:hypothetical protein